MEKEDPTFSISEIEFLNLLHLAKQNDTDAILKLLKFFENDMLYLSRYIRMPKEDSLQSMSLALIELFKKEH
ncbi:helix-turn-helix domain-containing protein [Paenibacillus alvei]|uniref:Helix-turn-helix domain-containing protein n=1 Tax=Paenibacillus alvei TaxID=44250 RepID=A0ABT4H3C1_PAEAL|nr:helix-turn-helix domain-containing protein [Paenibacillus alvei]MCY9763161.1 helix-turn-helix domain-containing protein [Paenibacillus alvei]MCY9769548.1 helix-turn-helix domain-containing protein [Paenibacillus alvei]